MISYDNVSDKEFLTQMAKNKSFGNFSKKVKKRKPIKAKRKQRSVDISLEQEEIISYLTSEDEELAQFTLVLGQAGTGKTTLIEEVRKHFKSDNFCHNGRFAVVITEIILCYIFHLLFLGYPIWFPQEQHVYYQSRLESH